MDNNYDTICSSCITRTMNIVWLGCPAAGLLSRTGCCPDMTCPEVAMSRIGPLKVIGVCKMRVLVKETGKSTDAMFVIIPGRYVTLLGRSTSEVLGILKMGIQVNGCDMQYPGYKGFPELK